MIPLLGRQRLAELITNGASEYLDRALLDLVAVKFGEGLPPLSRSTDHAIAFLLPPSPPNIIMIARMDDGLWDVHVNSISSQSKDHWVGEDEDLPMAIVKAWFDHYCRQAEVDS